jgi:hypothetical protein
MFTKIDELILPDHWYLDGEDDCYFIGEYTAGKGFSYSTTNQLIYNLKKSVDRRGLPEWVWKVRAIRQSARMIRESLDGAFIQSTTFVPVPPSRAASDHLYDDRMTQVLKLLDDHGDVRELVFQSEGMHDAHTAESRPGPGTLYQNYEIEESLVEPGPSAIAVVDDVLTTGAHFKAMKRILEETFPEVPVIGLFLARRVPDTE